MFIIIGGDGKEYGPVTPEQVRAWIAGGRANLDTKAKALGTEEWRRIGDFAEFAGPAGMPPIVNAPATAAPGAFSTTPAAAAVVTDPMAGDPGRRLGARLIDWAIEFMSAIPGAILLGGEAMKLLVALSQGKQPDFGDLDMARVGLGATVLGGAWLLVLVVQVVLLSTRGQSIGKIALGLRVVRFVDGGPAGFIHAWLLREFVITVIGIVLGIIPILGPFLLRPAFHITDWCMIFRADRRCLHDLMASTKVVRVDPTRR